MLSERRQDHCTAINRAATFRADVGSLPRDRVIIDVLSIANAARSASPSSAPLHETNVAD